MDFMLNPSFTSADNAVPLDPARIYDVMIVGGGPAALTAAVYCMRKGVFTGLVTADIGGQVAETSAVENYMGYKYIEGSELVARFREQVKQFGIGVSEGPKAAALIDGPVKQVRLDNGGVYQARTLILTTGKSWRRLNVPGEKELTGRGVAYCAICDAPFFAGKRVAVVGGGNSGIESAIDLAKIAEKVIVIQFLDTLTADRVLIDALGTFPNVEILYEHEVAEIRGTSRVEAVVVRDRKSKKQRDIGADGIFIEIGLVPNTGMVKDLLELNQAGEIVVDSACRTSRPGIFAAGDVTSVPFKQIIIAAGEGAKAALSACEYVLKHSS
jgi:alkyl hydroperoxide reductase subunit F